MYHLFHKLYFIFIILGLRFALKVCRHDMVDNEARIKG